MTTITITLRGAPAPYRHHSAPTGHRYLPRKQRDQLAMLRFAAQEAMDGRDPFDVPVGIELRVEIPIPTSWSKKKQYAATIGDLLPGSRPDLSNMLKLAEDACTGVVFRDDALIVEQAIRKIYSLQPGITLTIRPLWSPPVNTLAIAADVFGIKEHDIALSRSADKSPAEAP
jgi:Holliday junction resolvase RusA-like endonuclease